IEARLHKRAECLARRQQVIWLKRLQIQVTRQGTGRGRACTTHEVHTREATEINGAQSSLLATCAIGQPWHSDAVHPRCHAIAVDTAHVHTIVVPDEVDACTAPPREIFPAFDASFCQLYAIDAFAAVRQWLCASPHLNPAKSLNACPVRHDTFRTRALCLCGGSHQDELECSCCAR